MDSEPLSLLTYDLPAERIAEHPVEPRDASRLLVSGRGGEIEHHHFHDLDRLLPAGSLLLFNATRVVRARLLFRRPSGGRIEVFLLEPVEPSSDPARALAATGESVWVAMVGGARRLRRDRSVELAFPWDGGEGRLRASLVAEERGVTTVRLSWSPAELPLAEVLEGAGRIPLPPYIHRDATEVDAERYQTVYAREAGAVAAPTAGLHFTSDLLQRLRGNGVDVAEILLHVGAGTFAPVKGAVAEHRMHEEPIDVDRSIVMRLIEQEARGRAQAPLVLVGTTTLRTLESLYWYGVRLLRGERIEGDLLVPQWYPYQEAETDLPSLGDSLRRIIDDLDRLGLERLVGRTAIMIVPGYRFMTCDALITNFHQPGSTLLLLVAAWLGRDRWRELYEIALEAGYRFLSYGDGSLLWRPGSDDQDRSEPAREEL